jgi:uncharacterized Zn finger protein
MIQLRDEQQMSRAIAKARVVKPLVRVRGWRQYEVTNKATGASYEVTFDVRNGARLASCTCPAGQAGRVPCYHIAASAAGHLMIAAARVGQ